MLLLDREGDTFTFHIPPKLKPKPKPAPQQQEQQEQQEQERRCSAAAAAKKKKKKKNDNDKKRKREEHHVAGSKSQPQSCKPQPPSCNGNAADAGSSGDSSEGDSEGDEDVAEDAITVLSLPLETFPQPCASVMSDEFASQLQEDANDRHEEMAGVKRYVAENVVDGDGDADVIVSTITTNLTLAPVLYETVPQVNTDGFFSKCRDNADTRRVISETLGPDCWITRCKPFNGGQCFKFQPSCASEADEAKPKKKTNVISVKIWTNMTAHIVGTREISEFTAVAEFVRRIVETLKGGDKPVRLESYSVSMVNINCRSGMPVADRTRLADVLDGAGRSKVPWVLLDLNRHSAVRFTHYIRPGKKIAGSPAVKVFQTGNIILHVSRFDDIKRVLAFTLAKIRQCNGGECECENEGERDCERGERGEREDGGAEAEEEEEEEEEEEDGEEPEFF